MSSPEALQFDYEVLDGAKVEPAVLQKALLALPAVAKKRIVLIRRGHKLNSHNKKLILEFAQVKVDYAILILDYPDDELKNNFMAKLSPLAKNIHFQKSAGAVFGLTRKVHSALNPQLFSLRLQVIVQVLPESISVLLAKVAIDAANGQVHHS